MDFAEVLKARHMVRTYRPDPVDEETLRRIVKVIHRAPSAGFSQGHRLLVITDAGLRGRIADLYDPAYGGKGFPEWVRQAPVLIALCVREESYHERYRKPDKLDEDGTEIGWPVPYWWFDSGSLLVLLQLAAANEGLATGFFGPHEEGLFELLDLPDDWGLAGVVTLGYAPEEDGVRRELFRQQRLPLDELVEWRH
ncbi:nitroreductase family protein [Amycolatopsis sp. NPDC059021]|uniref:nitroreductase family protein n=1 Tax=Amycolatopsis sp. NPDC059021 TaxID=3346704 RepID=UPI00366E2B29